jgi:uncharacterized membrane protein
MINEPLNTSERAKVIGFFIMLLGTFIFAIIPIFLIFVALNRSKRYQNFAPLDSARVYVSIYYALVTLGFMVAGILNLIHVNGDEATPLFILSMMGVLMLVSSNVLLFSTLKKHQNWVIHYGIFVDKLDVDPNLPIDSEIVEK